MMRTAGFELTGRPFIGSVFSFIFKGYLATQLNGARMNRDERKVVRIC